MGDMKKLISVVVPVYNAGLYLDVCIKSILAQTYERFELLLVDNGSTDNSLEVIRSYKDERIREIDASSKKGVSFARNVGIKNAVGEYITFVDADDWVEKCFLEEAIDVLLRNNLDWVMGGIQKVFPSKSVPFMPLGENEYFEYLGDDVRKLIYKTVGYETTEAPEINDFHAAGPWCKVMKTSLVKKALFDERLTIGEDTVFNVRVLQNAGRCGVISSLWYSYRMSGDSAVSNYSIEAEPKIKLMLETLRDLLKGDPRAEYYWQVRAMKQMRGLLDRAVNCADDSDVWQRYYEMVTDDFWMSVAKGIPLKEAPIGRKTKLLVSFMKTGLKKPVVLGLSLFLVHWKKAVAPGKVKED